MILKMVVMAECQREAVEAEVVGWERKGTKAQFICQLHQMEYVQNANSDHLDTSLDVVLRKTLKLHSGSMVKSDGGQLPVPVVGIAREIVLPQNK